MWNVVIRAFAYLCHCIMSNAIVVMRGNMSAHLLRRLTSKTSCPTQLRRLFLDRAPLQGFQQLFPLCQSLSCLCVLEPLSTSLVLLRPLALLFRHCRLEEVVVGFGGMFCQTRRSSVVLNLPKIFVDFANDACLFPRFTARRCGGRSFVKLPAPLG